MRTQKAQMKYIYIAAMALMLNLGVATVFAQRYPVKMAYSGTSGPSAVNLQQPGTQTVEENFAGNGALGPFTFRLISAETTSPEQPPSTCSGPANIYFSRVAGAGVLRFQDGSLLKVNLTQGADCIDLAAQQGHCTLTFQITGGTGRFKDASGTLTLTETNVPVLTDALNNPVFFASTGEFTGTVSGVAREADGQEERQ
ncbi:MAG: hypothetical protein JWQ49_1870 [Edaphobacter sp.]|nr:hypothetical protein [Edaphobacter sp.]